MIYPIAILVVAIGVVAVMLGKVIPSFENMYKHVRRGLAAGDRRSSSSASPTASATSGISTSAARSAFVMTISWMLSNEKGRRVFDAAVLRLPIFGLMLRKIVVARFTRTLGTLLASGVPILDALDICARTAGNKTIERAIESTRQGVSEGQDMARPLAASKVFPNMVVADDRRRRADRCASTRCCRRSPTSTRKRSISRSAR